jgi:hypothetical protein
MNALRDLVAEELAKPVSPKVSKFAKAIAKKHGDSSRAVLFYGSCLRQAKLDGLMLDFYLIVSDYRSAYPKRWLAAANALIPPNVFHLEYDGLVAKYAVLSEKDFDRLAGPKTRNVSVWARFAQPSRLVWSADTASREKVIEAISWSAPTLLAAAGPRAREPLLDLWRRAFELTFSAELRAERKTRAGSVVDVDTGRYERFGAPALQAARALRGTVSTGWLARRVQGKVLSVARLAKASLTFADGADYIVWKINRHAGTDFALKPWQRKYPLLGAISLLPRLLRSGAVR